MNSNNILKNFLKIHRKLTKQYDVPAAALKNEKYNNGIVEHDDGSGQAPIKDIVYKKFKYIDGAMKFSYNALPVLFQLNGHDKNLLLFLMIYVMDQEDGTFRWNKVTWEQYADMNESIKGERPTFEVVRQSIPALLNYDIIRRVVPGKYMIDPVLYLGINRNIKKDLFSAYARLAELRNKSVKEVVSSED